MTWETCARLGWRHRRTSRARGARRDQRGVAAVEAGLISALLSPLMIGVLAYGQYFWQAQRMTVEPQVDQAQVYGAFGSCTSLTDLLKRSVVANVGHLADGVVVNASDVTATIVDFVPHQLGVDARLSVRVAVGQSAISGILPDGGQVVSDAYVHLDNVRLDVESC
jgi:Flp pilus assembly pilin Flp